MPFDHKQIEPKWQKYWDEHKTFKTDCYDDSTVPASGGGYVSGSCFASAGY